MNRPPDASGAPEDLVPGALDALPADAQEPGTVHVRPARPSDVPEILALVRELAEYERSAHEVQASEELVAELLFGTNTPGGTPAAFCHVVEAADAEAPHRLAGFALWFLNTSTWTGRHGIYLEDLYVRPAERGRGLGRALMAELARICLDRGYARLEWWVLDWNTPAIDFYRTLDARPMDEWTVHRLSGEPLRRLAGAPSTT